MTIAVCLFCGARKNGAFVECPECGRSPISDDEYAASLGLTDHYLGIQVLDSISAEIVSGAIIRLSNFEEGAQKELLLTIQSCDFRKILGIRDIG